MKYTLSHIVAVDRCRHHIDRLEITDPPWVVTIEPQKSKRSLDQNALYWKWIDIIRQHVGDTTGEWYSADQVHAYFKSLFLPSRVVSIGDQAPVRCCVSTTKLSVKEMHDYMEQVDRYCADRLHLLLPVRDNDVS